MTTTDHAYEAGAFGRCVTCNKRKTSHEGPPYQITNPPDSEPADWPSGVGTVVDIRQANRELDDSAQHEALVESLQPPGIKMILYSKQSMSKKSEEVEIEWPADWRLPQQGEVITGYGFVNWIEFDPASRTIKVSMRG